MASTATHSNIRATRVDGRVISKSSDMALELSAQADRDGMFFRSHVSGWLPAPAPEKATQ